MDFRLCSVLASGVTVLRAKVIQKSWLSRRNSAIFVSMFLQVFSVYASENVNIAERTALLVYQGGHPHQGHRSGSSQVSTYRFVWRKAARANDKDDYRSLTENEEHSWAVRDFLIDYARSFPSAVGLGYCLSFALSMLLAKLAYSSVVFHRP